MKLSALNLQNDSQYDEALIRILYTNSSDIELQLTDELVNKFETEHTYDISDFNVDGKVVIDYSEYLGTRTVEAVKFDNTSSTVDSIKVSSKITKDILRETNMYADSQDRTFT